MAAAELPVENPETSRTASAAPVASAPTAPEATGSPELAVGDGTSFSMQEPPRGPAMGPVAKLEAGREYSTEELDLIEQANKPKEYTSDQLDKSLVSTVFDDPTYIPTRDEYFEAKQLKARLKSEGKIPGLLEDAATGAQGFLQTIGDTIHEISDDPGEFLARSPATMKATAKKSWRNTNDVTRWIRQTNAPTPIGRDEQTGEFVFGQSGAGRSDAEVLAGQQQAAAGQGRSIRAVTEEDLKDEEFDRFVMERSRQKELEEWVASTTAPTEFVTRLVTGRNQTEQPMQATSELAGGLLEPTNIATMGVPLGAGAKTLGLSRLTKAGGARAARVLDRAAAKGIAGMETGAAKFQEIIQKGTKISPENQIKMAKWSAAGGIGGGVFGLDSDIPGVAQAQDAAKFIGGAYLGYKGGLGVLRTVQKIAGPTATILRVASDAGEGFDDIAQASVATKLEAFPELSLVREALENPTRFRPIESTPARLAADPRLGKQTRAIADALASPAIVQGVRGASAVATGAVKGAVANAPFVALALNADEDKAAANMFGMGVGFGALGGASGRFTGLEQRRAESRAFDTARMLMDVELAGGDVTKTIQTYSKQQLGDLAAMQGFFRDKVDFVPLGKADFDSNTQALGGAGAAGLHVQAAPGEKARVFVNLDAKRDGIVPHELGHALLKSGALGSAQADTIRSFTTRRYTQAGVEARGREYATAMIQNENAAKFPGQNFPVTPAAITAKMDELGQSGLLRGDMDPLDWARDEIFAEDFRQASQSMDFAGIRRHLPADGSWLGSMENFLGAQANALSISGVRIDPVTGQPDPLFKANPILATDPVLKKQLDQYLNNYRNWINHPEQTQARGVRVAPAGRASDLANNPQVTFHDYGNGVMANEFARMDPTTGQAVFRDQRDITAETIKRQQQVKTLVGSKLIPATDPNLGPKKTADGRVTVRGRILPQKFDFLNGFAQHQRGFARQFETAAATGESMQVRYHSIGSGDTGAFQIKKLGNLEAITREIIPWGWELSGPNNLLASVLDLTQFRNRAIKAINAGEPNIGRLYNNDIKLIEADLKQWMDNHRQDLPGSNKIGEQRRDAINSLIGIGTNINKAANPFSGKIAGPSSAIKQFRLDRVDAAVGTGRQGFHFDYDKANNNLLPEIPTPLPDLSRDLPTGQAMPDAKPLKPIEQMTDRQLSSFLRKHGEQPSSALDVARRWSDGDRMWGAHEMGDELSLSPITDMNDLSGFSRDRLISLPKSTEDALYNPQGQAMPDVHPIEESARMIHSVYDQSLLAKDRDTALYPQNPVKGSVVLPPRYGLIGNAPGMPKNFTEVRELVKLLADRVHDTGLRETEFAQKSARFYSDMGTEAVTLAEIINPQITGIERFNRADEMLRYLALGSVRTNVPVNSTKSAGAAAASLGEFTAGYKMGFGEIQRATRQSQADFNAGKHFDLDIKGVQDKVRTFYINGLSEMIESARKNGDTASAEMLQTRAAKSLKLVDPNASKLTPQQLAETERILDGKATIDMWDMAAKRVAVPGFILDPKKRSDLKQPFEWTQKTKAAKDTIGSPRWAKVAKELAINSPAELRYQQARTLGIEGNFDWTAETWKARLDSEAPFAGADFTTYTAGTDAGLSPGGGGRLYDAQQAIDGLLADELNRRGLASMFGKEKLKARNAQEILWAIEKKDNPILANNDLSLFSDSIQPLKMELQAIAGTGGQRNVRGAQVLDAMERAYTAMARQELPFEVATVGTGRTATAINSALQTMEQAGDTQSLARLTAHFANNLADELTGLATQHGIKLQVDSVKTDLGGFTMDDGVYTETPQITAIVRGDRGDTKYLMQVVNEAVEQQGGNIFRRPSAKELYDSAVEKQPVVSFETGQMTTAQRTAFVTDLAKIRDSNGNRIFTGYTPSDKGVFIGGQFYDGNFDQAVLNSKSAIKSVMAKHGISVFTSENMIVPSYRSSDPVSPSPFRDAVQKLFYDKAVSGIAANAPTSVMQPANVEANLKSRLKKNETMFIGREELDALAKAITESESMSADQALARAGQSMEIPGTKKMQSAFADYVSGKKSKFEALPAEDKKVVSGYIKQARETAKTLRDQEAAFSKAAKDGIRKRRAEIADRYDPQRAFDEIDAADLMGYMSQTEVTQ